MLLDQDLPELAARRVSHPAADPPPGRAYGAGGNRWPVKVTLRLLRRLRDPILNIADCGGSFGPVLEELASDLIHAHDFHMIAIPVTAANNLPLRLGPRVFYGTVVSELTALGKVQDPRSEGIPNPPGRIQCVS